MSRPPKLLTAREPKPRGDVVASPLFRPEVLAERQTQWLGTILLEPRLSAKFFTIFAAVAGLAVLTMIVFGTFTKKARINGLLVPTQGMARIFAPRPGVVTKIHVREGMMVAKGAPLLSLSAEVQSETLGATREEIAHRLRDRSDSLEAAKGVQNKLFEQQASDLDQRLAALQRERASIAEEVRLQRARVSVSKEALAREQAMRRRDLITLTRLQRTQQDHLEQEGRLQALVRNESALAREQAAAESLLRELPLRRQNDLAETERGVSALKQELAEAEANRQIVITAPHDGTVTALQVEAGSQAQTAIPLMSVVPKNSVLQAQLFSPSRAIGFVTPGQSVLLRYQAFPYQKFGLYDGVVASVSRTAVSPAELTQQLSGLTSLYGANEPVYRITVDLKRQTAQAYGQPVALQPGMQVEADVLIETRRLIEWALDPLYTLTGKISG